MTIVSTVNLVLGLVPMRPGNEATLYCTVTQRSLNCPRVISAVVERYITSEHEPNCATARYRLRVFRPSIAIKLVPTNEVQKSVLWLVDEHSNHMLPVGPLRSFSSTNERSVMIHHSCFKNQNAEGAALLSNRGDIPFRNPLVLWLNAGGALNRPALAPTAGYKPTRVQSTFLLPL